MKVGIITKPNEKGQIVIPKEIRDLLGIDKNAVLNLTVRGNGVYIYPVREVITALESDDSYVELLKRTQGIWAKESWGKSRKARKRVELKASEKRKKAW